MLFLPFPSSLSLLSLLSSPNFPHTLYLFTMVRPTLAGSLGLLALLQPALADVPATNPSTKTECQQNVDDKGGIYISPNSLSEYELSCNTDHYGGDLDHVGSDTYLGCTGACDANPDCIGYAYTPGNCWLKRTFTGKENSNDVDFALNIQRNLTAKPYQAPPKPLPITGSCGDYEKGSLPLRGKISQLEYKFKCGTDHPGGDIGAVSADTFDGCVGLCDTTLDCIGFAWVGGNGPGTCYLKGGITSGEVNSNVDFASKDSSTRKLETSTSIVASISVVVPTSVSVIESSIPIETATETRTVWSLTGTSSVPLSTVTKTRVVYTPTGFSTVPIKTVTSRVVILPLPFSKSSSQLQDESKTESALLTKTKMRVLLTPTGLSSVPVETVTSRVIALPLPFSGSSKSSKSQDEPKTGSAAKTETIKRVSIPSVLSIVPAKTSSSSSGRPVSSILSVLETRSKSGKPQGESTTESAVKTQTITRVNIPTGFATIAVPANTTSAATTKMVPFVLPPPAGVPDWAGAPLDAPMPTNSAGQPDPSGRPRPISRPEPVPGFNFPHFQPFINGVINDIWNRHHTHHPHRKHQGLRHRIGKFLRLNSKSDGAPNSGAESKGSSNAESEGSSNAESEGSSAAAPDGSSAAVSGRDPGTTVTASGFTNLVPATSSASLKEKPTSASDDVPKTDYISAPMINRPIPTLDAKPVVVGKALPKTSSGNVLNGYRGGRGFGGIGEPARASNATSEYLPQESYVDVSALPAVVPTPVSTEVVKPTETPKTECQELRAKKPKKLRTRVTKGNKDFDGLYLTPHQSWPETAECAARKGKLTPFTSLIHQKKEKK
jgi:hypothetical protein